MPAICAVFGCYSNTKRIRELLFHSFPKDEITKKNACKRADAFNTDFARICSMHFERLAYARNLNYELLGIPFPRTLQRLEDKTVPTLHLPTSGKMIIFFRVVISDDS